MINDLRLIENFDILFESNVVLYGAGFCGAGIYEMLQKIGIPVAYFCDSSPQKWGRIYKNTKIISPKELKQIKNISIIISTINIQLIDEIMYFIEETTIKTENIFTVLGLECSIVQNINDYRINNEYRNIFCLIADLKKTMAIIARLEINLIYILNFLKNDSNILVYQPGKVGSSSICYGLNKIGINNYHVHYLTSNNTQYLTRYISDYDKNEPAIKSYFSKIEKANKKILSILLSKNELIKIITIVREPLSRDFSELFQSFESFQTHTDIGPYAVMSMGTPIIDTCVDWLKKHAYDMSSENCRYGYQFDWFDKELKEVFGIDIFSFPFDKEKGYSVIKKSNIEVLVMKLEKLNELEPIIGNFIGVPVYRLVHVNEAKNKQYKYLYGNVKNTIKIPREIIDLYYKDNPRMDHFYTEKEKRSFLKKWEKNII